MRRSIIFLSFILIASVLGGFLNEGSMNAEGATYVSGVIDTHTTWDLAGSPYIIVGDVTVDYSKTLTINPGVQVLFDGYYSLNINGDIHAVGTPSNRITITSNSPSPNPGDWYRINLGTSSYIKYVDISYGYYGLYGESLFGTDIFYNNISNNVYGVYITSSELTYIDSNFISSNSAYGVYISQSGSYPHLFTIGSNNIISNFYGVYLTNSVEIMVVYNNFIGNYYQADDSYENHWNGQMTDGNYWSNYDEEAEGCFDNNPLDGICDDPYEIYFCVGDAFPHINPYNNMIPLDTSPPVITNLNPSFGSFINNNMTSINANYWDPSGIDIDSILMKVDSVDITSSANVTENGISYSSPSKLEDGLHTVYIEVKDTNGYLGFRTWSFIIDTKPPHALSSSPMGVEVPIETNFVVQWNKTMDWNSVNASFSYYDGISTYYANNGTFIHDPLTNTSTFDPNLNLNFETLYNVTFNTNATDFLGNPLDQDQDGTGGEIFQDELYWTFMTRSPEGYPSIEVLEPGGTLGQNYTQGDIIEILWNATDDSPLPPGSISIYYGNLMLGWITIATNEDNDGIYHWNTLSISCPDSYWVKLTIYDSIGQTSYDLSNYSFNMECPDDPPTIETWEPGGSIGQTYTQGDIVVVAWTASDDNPLPDNPIDITYGSEVTWTTIVTSNPNSEIYNWNTSDVPCPGIYWMNLSVIDSKGQITFDESNYGFTILCPVIDNPPLIAVYEPGGAFGQIYTQGDVITVTWVANDDYSLPANPINISYGDSITGWTTIVSDEANDGVYDWNTSGLSCPMVYWMNLSVYDSIGQTTFDVSNYSFNLLCPDIVPPLIINLFPQDSSVINDNTPSISANYTDSSGIDINSVLFKIDDLDVTSASDVDLEGITYTPPLALDEGLHTAYLEVKDVKGNLVTVLWSFTVNTSSHEIVPPTIINLNPADKSLAKNNTPLISADYLDVSGINLSSIILLVDGANLTSDAIVTVNNIEYIPSIPLWDGNHSIYLSVEDVHGNLAIATWSFAIDTTPPIILSSHLKPPDGATIKKRRPIIIVGYSDQFGIDLNSIMLRFDGVDVTSSASIYTNCISYTPNSDLSVGQHVVQIIIEDLNGNVAKKSWTFTVEITTEQEPERLLGWPVILAASTALILLVLLIILGKIAYDSKTRKKIKRKR